MLNDIEFILNRDKRDKTKESYKKQCDRASIMIDKEYLYMLKELSKEFKTTNKSFIEATIKHLYIEMEGGNEIE
jgi:hypothetical protein